MKKPIYFFIALLCCYFSITGCKPASHADAIYYNGKIYTVDSLFTVVTAFAIKDGKIVATGSDEAILKYDAPIKTDLKGAFVYPGFHDAHCHVYGYGIDLTKINLVGTTSFSAVIDTVNLHNEKRTGGWIFGRGWDQNDWEEKTYPDKAILDSLYPDIPVFLLRIDGHAALVNTKALQLAGINETTEVSGGELIKSGKHLTGIILDKAVDLVYEIVPKPDVKAQINALMQAQSDCFAVGLTHVTDAGIENGGEKYDLIKRIDSLQQSGKLKLRMNVMADLSELNLYTNSPKIKTPSLSVTGFKVYADGALGSRGACLLQPYSDEPNHYGYLIHSPKTLDSIAGVVAQTDYQLNTHCIGDSAQRLMLQLYSKYLKGDTNRRWRIEHAQVIDTADLHYYRDAHILPSVQPTHATSDMYWAEDRLGPVRVKGAYAYKWLMEQNGMVAAGSDFPVEYINPLFGFYAAVSRKDQKGFPAKGFQPENALTRQEALRAMTIWAAYAAFNENETGSLTIGKYADFVITDQDLMTAPEPLLWQTKVIATYVGGEHVYGRLP
ncbi:MAG TPA: amidohydrolase [Bacteroidia bacterium]|nr:amidohydrolase [Bacteroidia bacterium]